MRRVFRLRYATCVVALVQVFLFAIAHSAESPTPTLARVSFSRDIAPIFLAKCQTCHSAEKPKGKYQLDSFEHLMKQGASGEAPVVAAKPDTSALYRLLIEKDPDDRMPQKDDPLPTAQITLIKRWILEGAKFDGPDPSAALASIVPRAPHPEPPDKYPFPVPITALAFHPLTNELFVSGYHELTVWDPEKGELLRRIKDMPREVHSLVFNPDGATLAVAGGLAGRSGELTLVEVATGKVKQRLLTLNDVVLTAAFSPDGKWLAAGGADNAIHLFDIGTGKERLTISQHADWVMNIAFSPDGSRIASASRDRTVRIFSVAKGELESTYTGHDSYVDAVAFASDGKTAFSAGRDKKIGVWKTEDGNQSAVISGFEGEVFGLLRVGDVLASACADHQVRLHKLADRSLVATLSGHGDWVYSLSANPTGTRLASGSYNGGVRVWKVGDHSLISAFTAAPGFIAGK